jgi:hypothetical protein
MKLACSIADFPTAKLLPNSGDNRGFMTIFSSDLSRYAQHLREGHAL